METMYAGHCCKHYIPSCLQECFNKEYSMDFWPPQSRNERKFYDHTMFYAEHLMRSLLQGFAPLTEDQYRVLCKKIETNA